MENKLIINIIARCLNIEDEQVKLSSDFVNDLYADSLDMLSIYEMVEATLNITLPPKYTEGIETVQDLIDVIYNVIQKKK